ncbi:MAG: glycosyltransferase [Desulfobacterales bacterium]|nr:glycosyltransferase [Desulfobacterales bacterium]MDD4073464.1 glycosyltransferase [Desulfobacterales bacterium]MDD4392763.1 glycosyltransferase [Desulfobacterales bacterium]
MRTDRKSKIRLLHLVQTLGVGGAEILMCHHIRALGFKDYEHFVYCFGNDGPVREKIESMGVPVRLGKKMAVLKTPFKFVVAFLALVQDILSVIRSRDIQFIQSHLGQANQMSIFISMISGIPAFPTVHSTMAFLDTRNFWDPRALLINVLNHALYRLAEHVIVVSEEIKIIIRKRYGLEDSKILVLKNGIIVEDVHEPSISWEKVFDTTEMGVKIVAVGRLVVSKGFDILVKAVAKLAADGNSSLRVVIAGEGEQRPELEKLIKDLNVENFIRLIGLRNDVQKLMDVSDIFVMPSRYEGLSIAMIEAMACGLPIVASDAPGLRDFITDYRNGLTFPVDDHEALAVCIKRLLNNAGLRRTLSDNARRSFDVEYNMLNNIRALDAVYRNVVASAG